MCTLKNTCLLLLELFHLFLNKTIHNAKKIQKLAILKKINITLYQNQLY